MTKKSVLVAESLVRRRGASTVLREVSLTFSAGESAALVGRSGCGKTTLLHILGLLDRPTEGRVLFEGHDPWQESASHRAWLRLTRVGFVFQQSNLLPQLTVRENVALPAWHLGADRRAALQRAQELVERLGLATRADARGSELSLGEAQRVAVARALVNRPALILADEPTGSLDSDSAAAVMAALAEISHQGTALIIATHDATVARSMHRIIRMSDGHLAPRLEREGAAAG
jgi:ABC-type lipoprotein export system ATPase subunit